MVFYSATGLGVFIAGMRNLEESEIISCGPTIHFSQPAAALTRADWWLSSIVGSEGMLPRPIKKVLYALPERLMLRFGRQFSLDGIKLVIFLQDRERAELLRTKVATALCLIQNHTPKYYARVQKFIPNILIFGAHAYTAVYSSELKLCDISRNYALSEKTTASRLAMTLVHEATHGFLASKGITYQEQRRGQIERICVQAEIAFARGLPDPGNLLAEAESRLSFDSEFWNREAFFQRDLTALKNFGGPQWLVTYFRNRRTRRTQPGRSSGPPLR